MQTATFPEGFLCRPLEESDINRIIPLYIDYYNTEEDGAWTPATVYKRIHQVWSAEDALCLLLEKDSEPIGFFMGHFEQYDDIKAYDLIEIVIAAPYQSQGLGSTFMKELEHQVKAHGGAMIQLQAVNDDRHERFYSRLQYKTTNSLVLKSKWLSAEND